MAVTVTTDLVIRHAMDATQVFPEEAGIIIPIVPLLKMNLAI